MPLLGFELARRLRQSSRFHHATDYTTEVAHRDLALGGLVFGADRVFMSGGVSSAEAQDEEAAALLLAAGATDVDDVREQLAAQSAPSSSEVLAARLAALSAERSFDLSDLPNIFEPSSDWLPDAAPLRLRVRKCRSKTT